MENLLQMNSKEIPAALIKRIRKGDVSAYKLVFTTYWNPLLNYANRFVKDLEQSENIVQDTFVYIWENRSKLNPDQNLKTYLFIAVRNRSLNFLRSASESKRSDEILTEIHDTITAHHEIENNELSKAVYKAIEMLPDKCKEIFEMNKFDKLTYKEISDVLGISIKTVETQMSRALKKLRILLAHLIILIISLKFL